MARILIIDDDDLIRTSVSRLLRVKGHDVDVAENGEVGVEKFRKDPVELVITDIFLPKKDGLEIITELRADFPEVKIIALSGGGLIDEESVLRSARGLGANHCLPKPVKSADLFAAVKDLVGDDTLPTSGPDPE